MAGLTTDLRGRAVAAADAQVKRAAARQRQDRERERELYRRQVADAVTNMLGTQLHPEHVTLIGETSESRDRRNAERRKSMDGASKSAPRTGDITDDEGCGRYDVRHAVFQIDGLDFRADAKTYGHAMSVTVHLSVDRGDGKYHGFSSLAELGHALEGRR